MQTMGKAIDWRGYISVDPEVCHGKPCFKGTRIMVSTVLEFLEDGAGLAEIREGYPSLTQAHVRAALGFARETLENGRYVALSSARNAFSR